MTTKLKIQLFNGPTIETEAPFAWIATHCFDIRSTIHGLDTETEEYEAWHLTIDVDGNVTAHSWFKMN